MTPPPEVRVTWHDEIDPQRTRRVAELLLAIIDTAQAEAAPSTSESTPEEKREP